VNFLNLFDKCKRILNWWMRIWLVFTIYCHANSWRHWFGRRAEEGVVAAIRWEGQRAHNPTLAPVKFIRARTTSGNRHFTNENYGMLICWWIALNEIHVHIWFIFILLYYVCSGINSHWSDIISRQKRARLSQLW